MGQFHSTLSTNLIVRLRLRFAKWLGMTRTRLENDTRRIAPSIRFRTRLEKTSPSAQCVAKCS